MDYNRVFTIGSTAGFNLTKDNKFARADVDLVLHSKRDSDLESLLLSTHKKIGGTLRLEFHENDILYECMISGKYKTIDILYTLKCSHCFFNSPHRKKTFEHMKIFAQHQAELIPDLFDKLYEWHCDKFGEPFRVDFSQEINDFFNDNVSRPAFHDELHHLVKRGSEPAYKLLQEEGQNTAYVDEGKFFKKLTNQQRDWVIIEEIETLMIEREYYISTKKPEKLVYHRWLDNCIQRLVPMWMAKYILQNYLYYLNYETNARGAAKRYHVEF